MKRLLNTLYVTTPGAALYREGDTVKVRASGATRLQVPLHGLESIVCFGQPGVSSPLLDLCTKQGVPIAFLTESGRFLARIQGPQSGNVFLRREQYRRAGLPAPAAAVTRGVVGAKVANARAVLLRAGRDRPGQDGHHVLKDAAARLVGILDRVRTSGAVDTLRGLEGEAARVYFSVFDHLITRDKEHFFFRERNRRPPLDNMNALLSFLYTLLTHDMVSALEGVGLDPAVGFLHRDRPGRPGLALDLIEEFRPFLADRLALSLVNRQQVQSGGFRRQETGAILMDGDTRKTVLVAYQKRKQEEILHPFLGEKIAIGLIPHVQSLLLARHLRDDLEAYPPFFWKG
ncbi:MAG: type I-C CRISPR-associated endonuclease Cas1c [Nitrospinaceae bacterium]